MAAQVAAHQHHVARFDARRIDRLGRLHQADAAGVHGDPVALAPLHHLGVTGHDAQPLLTGRLGHGGDHRFRTSPIPW
ncbi:hypothetical protein KQ307_04415 [Synechococcus sp. CS-1326]|nr:hypothetical protein [Synechococcus sp. CS-1326]